MEEIIYFESKPNIFISNLRFEIWGQPQSLPDLVDFNIVQRRSWDSFSMSLDGIQLGTPYYQLELRGGFGTRLVWEQVRFNDRRNLSILRAVTLALSNYLNDKREEQGINDLIPKTATERGGHPIPFSYKIGNVSIPRELSSLETVLIRLMEEPDDDLASIGIRFAQSVSSSPVFHTSLIPIQTKIVYEYYRKFGTLDYPFRPFRSKPYLTLGEVLRPLKEDEIDCLMAFRNRYWMAPL